VEHATVYPTKNPNVYSGNYRQRALWLGFETQLVHQIFFNGSPSSKRIPTWLSQLGKVKGGEEEEWRPTSVTPLPGTSKDYTKIGHGAHFPNGTAGLQYKLNIVPWYIIFGTSWLFTSHFSNGQAIRAMWENLTFTGKYIPGGQGGLRDFVMID